LKRQLDHPPEERFGLDDALGRKLREALPPELVVLPGFQVLDRSRVNARLLAGGQRRLERAGDRQDGVSSVLCLRYGLGAGRELCYVGRSGRMLIAPEQAAPDQEQQREDGELDAGDPLLAAFAVIPRKHEHGRQPDRCGHRA
jgi:hypothetical protein